MPIRRAADRFRMFVDVATLIGLFTILFTVFRANYTDFAASATKFKEELALIVKEQNSQIKELWRECCR